MHYCKGCGVEIRPSLKRGRPRKWCDQCKPRLIKVVKDDHDRLVTLEVAADEEADAAERHERKHRHDPKPKVDEDDPDNWL